MRSIYSRPKRSIFAGGHYISSKDGLDEIGSIWQYAENTTFYWKVSWILRSFAFVEPYVHQNLSAHPGIRTQKFAGVHSWQMGRVLQRSFKSNHYHNIGHTGSTFGGRKIIAVALVKSVEDCFGSGVYGRLLLAAKSLQFCSEVCVRVGGVKSEPFTMRVGFRQGCVLSTLLSIVYELNSRQTAESTRVSLLKVSGSILCLLRTIWYCLHPLNGVFNMHFIGFLLRAAKRECKLALKDRDTVLYLSRNSSQRTLPVIGNTFQQVEKFNYLGDVFMSDRKWNNKIDTRIGIANAAPRELYCFVVAKRVLSRGLGDNVRSSEICKARIVEPLLLRIERSQLRWFGHLSRISQKRLARQLRLATPTRKWPWSRPRTRWRDCISDLALSRLGVEPVELYLRLPKTVGISSPPRASALAALPRRKADVTMNQWIGKLQFSALFCRNPYLSQYFCSKKLWRRMWSFLLTHKNPLQRRKERFLLRQPSVLICSLLGSNALL